MRGKGELYDAGRNCIMRYANISYVNIIYSNFHQYVFDADFESGFFDNFGPSKYMHDISKYRAEISTDQNCQKKTGFKNRVENILVKIWTYYIHVWNIGWPQPTIRPYWYDKILLILEQIENFSPESEGIYYNRTLKF